jgi:hypothetical protein
VEEQMDAFIQNVNGWHDFYHVIGDVSAALVGLLFVSISINADVIIRKANSDLLLLAGQTFMSYFSVLLYAVIFLIPDQGPVGLGLPMLGINLIFLGFSIYRISKILKKQAWSVLMGSVFHSLLLPTVCFIAVIIISMSILSGETRGLYWFVPVVILLLFHSSINAWNLLLGFRKAKA